MKRTCKVCGSSDDVRTMVRYCKHWWAHRDCAQLPTVVSIPSDKVQAQLHRDFKNYVDK